MKNPLIIVFCFFTMNALCQTRSVSLEEAIAQARANNKNIVAASQELASQKQMKKTSFDLPKTEVVVLYGQYNSSADNDNNVTISQSIPFSVFGSQASLNSALVRSAALGQDVTENEIIYQVKKAYYSLAYAKARRKLLLRQDSIFEGFYNSSSLRYQTGETNLLEQTTADAQRNESKILLRQNESDVQGYRNELRMLMNVSFSPDLKQDELNALSFIVVDDSTIHQSNPYYQYMRQQVEVAHRERKVQESKMMPDLLIGFFSQTLIGTPVENGVVASGRERFTGFQIGLSIPIWIAPYRGRIKAASLNRQAQLSKLESYENSFHNQQRQATERLVTYQNSLDFYTQSGLPNSDLILKHAETSFREGDIGYLEYLSAIRNAVAIQEGYLKAINDLNQTIVYIEYLTGRNKI